MNNKIEPTYHTGNFVKYPLMPNGMPAAIIPATISYTILRIFFTIGEKLSKIKNKIFAWL